MSGTAVSSWIQIYLLVKIFYEIKSWAGDDHNQEVNGKGM
jgi:hypothetical protein